MNKIYNNFNIKNLVKSDWMDQFDKDQQEVILKGAEFFEVDILLFAKKEFNWQQMLEIRFGLENNLDVSIYAKSYFNPWQMGQIREGLKDNLDVSLYAKPEFDEYHMNQIRLKMLEESTL